MAKFLRLQWVDVVLYYEQQISSTITAIYGIKTSHLYQQVTRSILIWWSLEINLVLHIDTQMHCWLMSIMLNVNKSCAKWIKIVFQLN